MAEEKEYIFGPQPYQFGQDEPPKAPPAPPTSEKEPITGVEDRSYDTVTMQGAPDNPKNAREVIERGVVNVANPPKRERETPPLSLEEQERTDTPPTTDNLSPEEQERADAVAGTDRQIKTIQDWMQSEQNRPETEEQRKKRERREKSKKIIAAVSDGISALSNLFFTTRYAPNIYNHERGSQLNATNERIERLKAEREKKRDEYLNFSLKLGDLENDRAKTLRELEAQQEARKIAKQKAEDEAKRAAFERSLWPDKTEEQKGKTRKAMAEGEKAEKELSYVDEHERGKIDLNNARIATEASKQKSNNASAANSYASARSHDRSNPKEFSAWDEKGNEHRFDKEDAAIAYAKQHGTYKETEEEETSTTKGKSAGRATDTTTTKTKKTGYPARPQKKQSPTAGGGGGKKSPTA